MTMKGEHDLEFRSSSTRSFIHKHIHSIIYMQHMFPRVALLSYRYHLLASLTKGSAGKAASLMILLFVD